MTQISNIQITSGNWHSGLTQASHLSTFFQTKPAEASAFLQRVYGQMTGYKNAVSFLTSGLGRTKALNNIQYRWSLIGNSQKAIPVSKTYGDGGSTPGIAGTTFRVGFPEKWFTIGDVIVPDDTTYPARVMEEAYQDGVDFVYTLQLVTGDDSKYMPLYLLESGREFSKDFNIVEHDGSSTSGETTYAQPFMLENYMSTFRKRYSVTGAAMNKVLEFKVMDPKTSAVASTWVKYAEWEFWAQWADEIERAMVYGTSNIKPNSSVNMKGKSGNAVYSGVGLEGQISGANKRYYTRLTEGIIRSFLDDLSYNGTEDGPREYVALCGRGFMNAFDEAMKSSVNRSQYTLAPNTFVTGSGQELTLGGQFVTYIGLNGDKITLKECTLYNDVVRNRILHPKTAKPAESYKATFLNFKMNKGGESNIQKVYHEGREMVTAYINGLADPFGVTKNVKASSSFDGYQFEVLSECGLMIKDPTDAGQLILDVAGF